MNKITATDLHSTKIIESSASLDAAKSTHAVEKYEKHIKESEPILAGVLTPYEAFKYGFESAIASFIKLGQEEKIKNKVVFSPQNKNVETELLEYLIKNLFKDFNSVKFIKKENRYLAISEGKIYQFSSLLEKANFNQICLDKTELNAYQTLLDTQQLFCQPYLWLTGDKPTEEDFNQLDYEQICGKISFAEKEAINIYTGQSYYMMNALMRGEIEEAIEGNYSLPDYLTRKEKINQTLKECLLHITVAISGLNKLPDYNPSIGMDGQPFKYLYRAENFLPEEVLAKRKWAVLNGGGLTLEMGFISTAFARPAENFFTEETQVGLMIKNLKGKKITPLSQFGQSEREILIPPTQIQWLYHKDIQTDVFQNKIDLFIAKPVTADIVPLPGITKEIFVQAIDINHHFSAENDTILT